jgi:hypothetical protein
MHRVTMIGVVFTCLMSAAGLPAAKRLVMAAPVETIDVLAREPMIAQHPAGALFVAGYGHPSPTLWKSTDGGGRWTRVNVGSEADGAVGNSDVDLAVSRAGTLYFVTMGFKRTVGEGTHITVGVSRDIGASWKWTIISRTRFDDRPWVEVERDGTAHVIWNDGSGVRHAMSRDDGATWNEGPRIHDKGGSSHLAVGPSREVAVRVAPFSASGNKVDEGVDLIAVSTDGGATWRKTPAPGVREWSVPIFGPDAFPRWVEPLAWDARGALYSLWTNREGLWLARSKDQGATWTTWRLIESADLLYFPYLIARGRGELAASWTSGRADALQTHVARIDVGDGAPQFLETSFVPETYGFGTSNSVRDTAGEYVPVVFLKNGDLGVVSTIQNQAKSRFGFSWRKVSPR